MKYIPLKNLLFIFLFISLLGIVYTGIRTTDGDIVEKKESSENPFQIDINEYMFQYYLNQYGNCEGNDNVICYNVSSLEDSLQEGSLRYALEKIEKNPGQILHISFAPDLLSGDNSQKLIFTKRLNIRGENIFIDGYGGNVIFSREHHWDMAKKSLIFDTNHYDCTLKEKDDRTIIKIGNNSQNIIISSIKFDTHIDGMAPSFPLESNTDHRRLDTGCFGDAITISDNYDNILISDSHFSYCPDGCIDIVRPSNITKSHVFIKNNIFSDSRKTMIVGRKDNNPGLLHVLIENNQFISNEQRQPRVENANVCFKGNTIQDWGRYGIGIFDNTNIYIVDNNFIPGDREKDAFRAFGKGKVFSKNNTLQLNIPQDLQITLNPFCMSDKNN